MDAQEVRKPESHSYKIVAACSFIAASAFVSYFMHLIKKPYNDMAQAPTKVVEGTVVEELYSPSEFARPASYRFSIETSQEGRISVSVLPGRKSLETIDTLIHPGDYVRATVHDLGDRTYRADADRVLQNRQGL